MGGGVDLDPLTVPDGALQNLGDGGFDHRKRRGPRLVVPGDQVEVAEDAVMLEPLHDGVHLFVIAVVVFLLGAAPLEVAGPELLILHLVDRKDDEVEGVAAVERLELGDGVLLDAELHAGADDDPVAVEGFHPFDFSHKLRVIDVGKRFAVPVLDLFAAVPVDLDPVVDVVGDADFVHPHPDGVADDLFHRIDRIVAEGCVHMVVGKHDFHPFCILYRSRGTTSSGYQHMHPLDLLPLSYSFGGKKSRRISFRFCKQAFRREKRRELSPTF